MKQNKIAEESLTFEKGKSDVLKIETLKYL